MKIKNREFIIMDKMEFTNYFLNKTKKTEPSYLDHIESRWVKFSKGFNFVLKEVNENNFYSVLHIHEQIRQGKKI